MAFWRINASNSRMVAKSAEKSRENREKNSELLNLG